MEAVAYDLDAWEETVPQLREVPAKPGKKVQVNVRVDAEIKRKAEAVLDLAGSSATQLVRMAYAKAAEGVDGYQEFVATCMGEPKREVVDGVDAVLSAGWEIAEQFYRSIGYDVEGGVRDTRSPEEVYEEAMAAHFEEKGLIR